MLGFVPQTPLASPYSPSGILRQALASPFGRRGDAQGTSGETRLGTVAPQPTQYILCGSNPRVLDGIVG
ncbi:hypothetical protein [Nostoc sp.]|uniref:hypothetical protein n=1 Tax=Nostoc sp. TaxID=1180 RepID=UPI002FF5496E